jgi:hypothetical protein
VLVTELSIQIVPATAEVGLELPMWFEFNAEIVALRFVLKFGKL